MKITFLGGVREVTGSHHLLEINGRRILLDCGLRQGKGLPKAPEFPFKASDVDAVVLSHAHLDHSGLLPFLAESGFSGKIYSTSATRELARLLLLDAAKIMREDYGKGLSDTPPLYDEEAVHRTIRMFETADYNQEIEISPEVSLKFLDAGHILGSAISLLKIRGVGSLCYTGDIGHGRSPILNPPQVPEEDVAFLIIESTYGNRKHGRGGEKELENVITKTLSRGGKVLIPVFAVGRAQEILFCIKRLVEEGKINAKVYVDTPMGESATDLYSSFSNYLREEFREHFLRGKSPFEFPGLEFVRGHKTSLDIAESEEPCIILAASGMLEGGRVLNHLPGILKNERHSLVFVGYQAEGTLGREILEAANSTMRRVRINDTEVELKCNIVAVSSFSAHADIDNLLEFASRLKYCPYRTFVVHGEYESSLNLANELIKLKHRARVPGIKEEFSLGFTRVVVEKTRDVELGFSPEFTCLRDAEVAVFSGGLVKTASGTKLLNKQRFLEFLDELLTKEEEGLKARVRVKSGLTDLKKEEESKKALISEREIIEKFRAFQEKGILTKRLMESIYCELLTSGDEAIRMLNEKRRKKRFNITDEKVIDEFCDFMVKLLDSVNEKVIIRCLKKFDIHPEC